VVGHAASYLTALRNTAAHTKVTPIRASTTMNIEMPLRRFLRAIFLSTSRPPWVQPTTRSTAMTAKSSAKYSIE
jgi:hypothetical protein